LRFRLCQSLLSVEIGFPGATIIPVRLVSYNILDGGEGRADQLAEVIESQKPDVVVLVEADLPAVVEGIAGRLKMDFIIGDGRRHDGAILACGRIVESVNHSVLRDEFSDLVLEATVEAAGREWAVAAVHLHPRARLEDERRREGEIDGILEIFAPHRAEGRAHLLAGDFNANSPVQQVIIEKCKARTRQDIAANGGVLPRTAVAKLLEAGYLDTLHSVLGREAETMGSFTTQEPGQRVDYIFSHGIDAGRLRNAKIEQGRLAKDASDHFPVMVEIE
jgi:endonuclease/exonuclease/phosphatase family metal-dependent hydrolase